jgi:hypothetical protein
MAEIHDLKCVKETEKAICVEGGELEESAWIPKSQIAAESEVCTMGTTGTLVIPDWLAEKKGWL